MQCCRTLPSITGWGHPWFIAVNIQQYLYRSPPVVLPSSINCASIVAQKNRSSYFPFTYRCAIMLRKQFVHITPTVVPSDDVGMYCSTTLLHWGVLFGNTMAFALASGYYFTMHWYLDTASQCASIFAQKKVGYLLWVSSGYYLIIFFLLTIAHRILFYFFTYECTRPIISNSYLRLFKR